MIKALLKKSIGCGIIVLGIAATSWAMEQGQLDALEKLIQDGKWTEASESAKVLKTADATAAIPVYVMDIASDVTGDLSGRSSQYQFPYSDKNAISEIQSWSEALMKKVPNNANVLFTAARVYSSKALLNTSKFVDLLEQAKTASPNSDYILTALGAGYGVQGKFDEAIDTLQKASDINPKSSDALTNLGVAYLKIGENEKALDALKKATEINPLDGAAFSNLGSYYAQQNMTDEAKPLLEKAIECSPQLLDARWNLGGIYFNSGEQDKAIEQLKEMIKIAPDSQMGQNAQDMLSQLGG